MILKTSFNHLASSPLDTWMFFFGWYLDWNLLTGITCQPFTCCWPGWPWSGGVDAWWHSSGNRLCLRASFLNELGTIERTLGRLRRSDERSSQCAFSPRWSAWLPIVRVLRLSGPRHSGRWLRLRPRRLGPMGLHRLGCQRSCWPCPLPLGSSEVSSESPKSLMEKCLGPVHGGWCSGQANLRLHSQASFFFLHFCQLPQIRPSMTGRARWLRSHGSGLGVQELAGDDVSKFCNLLLLWLDFRDQLIDRSDIGLAHILFRLNCRGHTEDHREEDAQWGHDFLGHHSKALQNLLTSRHVRLWHTLWKDREAFQSGHLMQEGLILWVHPISCKDQPCQLQTSHSDSLSAVKTCSVSWDSMRLHSNQCWLLDSSWFWWTIRKELLWEQLQSKAKCVDDHDTTESATAWNCMTPGCYQNEILPCLDIPGLIDGLRVAAFARQRTHALLRSRYGWPLCLKWPNLMTGALTDELGWSGSLLRRWPGWPHWFPSVDGWLSSTASCAACGSLWSLPLYPNYPIYIYEPY